MSAEPIVETFPVGPLQCNCTILGDPASREAVVIDPGDEPERILRALEAARLKPVALLHTHAHLDHITGSRAVREATSAPIRLHPADRPLYDALPDQGLNDCHIEQPGWPRAATSDASDGLCRHSKEGGKSFDPLLLQLPAMHQHKRIDPTLRDQPRANHGLSEGGSCCQHSRIMGKHSLGGDGLLGAQLTLKCRI